MSSFAPCLHEEVDTRIYACATEPAKRPNKKISSCAVDTDVVVLVINCWAGKNRRLSLV